MSGTSRRVDVVYFNEPGVQNTEETLRHAHRRAQELGVEDIVVASTTGETGLKACQVFKGFNVVVVRHHTGFRKPGIQEMKKELEYLEDRIKEMREELSKLDDVRRSIQREITELTTKREALKREIAAQQTTDIKLNI